MKDADKIQDFENRIAELEKQVEGAKIILMSIAPFLGVIGKVAILSGKIDNGSQFVVFANQLKNPDNLDKMFKNAVENRETVMAMGKILEAEIKKIG